MADAGPYPENMQTLIEHRTIAPVPESERTGTGKGLFGIWVGINMLPLTVVTGALGTTLFGLPFWWSVLAIVLGNVVGGFFMGLHASQGPTLGVPQMLQARGQFGSKGAALIVLVAVVMFMGFFVSNLVVGSEFLHEVISGISVKAGIVLATLVSMVVTVFGLRLIKVVVSACALVVGVLVVITFIKIMFEGVPTGTMSAGSATAAGFFSMLAVGAVWQIAYAPYVSDYSRYMPAGSGTRGAFWGTYGGSVVSSILVMALGSLLGILASDGDAVTGLNETTGSLANIILLGFAAASMLINAGNIYCATLNVLTFLETFRPGWIPAARGRLVTASLLHILGLVLALGMSADFLTKFSNFMFLLLYVLIPWSAINLVDYFLIAHGDYAVDDFYKQDGGRYGQWNWAALGVYVVGLLVQIPFAVLPQYTGPIAESLDYVDLAWVFGLVVSGGLYYVIARGKRRSLTVETSEPQPA